MTVSPSALEELVTANRILAREGVVDSFGHVSIRHPDDAGRYLLSRARAPECIEADDVMQFTLEGAPLDAGGRKSYSERFIHGAIYQARPDVHAVVHNHSPSVIPFGITGAALRPVMHMCASMGTQVPTWDSRTNFGDTNLLVTNMEMARDLAAALGDRPVALMRGHGCVIAGTSLREVVFNAVYLELNAELQMKASSLRADHVPQRRRSRGGARYPPLVHVRARVGGTGAGGPGVRTISGRWRVRSPVDTEVLIVGAGPVGLTLAIDLGRRGIRCTLVEKKEAPEFLPKMERCNARTMEIFRRMGLAGKIRAAGLPRDVPMDVYVALAMNEPPLLRLKYPSVAEAEAQTAACNDGSMPLEPYQLISQYTLEPLLKAEADALCGVAVRYGCEFLSLSQDAEGATAHVRHAGGAVQDIRAQFVVGCDGGASVVRKQLGIQLRGEGNLLRLYQALYYCPDLFDMIPIGAGPGRGRHYHIADAQSTFLIMQDSTRHWTLHAVVDQKEQMAPQFERTVGVPVRYDMLYVGEWKQNLLLADRYREGRVLSRRRLRPSRDSYRRIGHEHRHRRCHRSRVEAPRGAARLGRSAPPGLVRDRAPAGRRPQRRGFALRVARQAQVAFAVSARHPGCDGGRAGHARQPGAGGGRRAAEDE